MFEDALDMAHANVLRSLELMWSRYIDEAANYYVPPAGGTSAASINGSITSAVQLLLEEGSDNKSAMATRNPAYRNMGTNREFWVNNITTLSQWTRPYWPHIFRSQDIEMDIFVQVLIQKDIFAIW
ncbi:hypothetical protein EON65_08760 [archaeon]|nr:MAG: hypothetical protein EON65_08760 [archaeon]